MEKDMSEEVSISHLSLSDIIGNSDLADGDVELFIRRSPITGLLVGGLTLGYGSEFWDTDSLDDYWLCWDEIYQSKMTPIVLGTTVTQVMASLKSVVKQQQLESVADLQRWDSNLREFYNAQIQTDPFG